MKVHEQRLALMGAKGFFPRVIYDIGAYRGYWSYVVQQIFPYASFYLFEANEQHISDLEKLPFPYFIHLLGDQEKMVTFYSNGKEGDSVFRENTSFYQDEKMDARSLQMTTLSSVVQKHQLPPPDLIKLDVQGAEKLIIEGSQQLMCLAEMMVIETKILEYNHQAPLMHELVTFMNRLGYQVLDVLELHYLPTGELCEVDFLFVKQNSVFIKKGLLV
jgi:FkbM family methyltransferase